MPYISAAQRYSHKHTRSGEDAANPALPKMPQMRTTIHVNRDTDKRMPHLSSSPSFTQPYHPLRQNLHQYGVGSGYGFGQQDWQPYAGREGFGYFGCQGQFHPQHYGGYPYGGAGSYHQVPEEAATASWEQVQRNWYPPIPPAAPTGQGFFGQDYGQPQHQYASIPYSYQPHSCSNEYDSAGYQSLLTRHQDNHEVPPPPPPTDGLAQQSALSAKSPAFVPERPLKSVAASPLGRSFRIDKQSRFGQPRGHTPGSSTTLEHGPTPRPPPTDDVNDTAARIVGLSFSKNKGRRARAANWRTPASHNQLNGALQRTTLSPAAPNPFLKPSTTPQGPHPPPTVMVQPQPSEAYLKKANETPFTTDKPRSLLIVLDLNGTLLHRTARFGGKTFQPRPHVEEFLHYLFANHHVMVWSSAMPKNVNGMCQKLLTPEQNERLVACWARDKLRIPDQIYFTKVQSYKQLTWVWKDADICAANPDPVEFWNQENTVLIDDSDIKAASEPSNLIRVQEFEGVKGGPVQYDVLGQVVTYLETLRSQRNVSAYIRRQPFEYDAGVDFDWMPVVADMH